MPGMKKLDIQVLVEALALPHQTRGAVSDALAIAAHVKKGMASVSRLDSLAVPVGTGGLWTVPLFERFPHLIDVLGTGVRSETVLLMIDLSGFSSGTSQLNPGEIRTILDPFYNKVVSEVEQSGGVVEKFIGDAVIALFGHPFRSVANKDLTTKKTDLQAALAVAKACIAWSHTQYKGAMTAKAAATYGELFIGWVGPESYSDLTVIGRCMTELFRLEAAAPDQGIIMPRWFFDGNIKEATSWASAGEYAPWIHAQGNVNLRGLGDLDVTKLIYNPRD